MRSAKRINGFLISTALVISLVAPILGASPTSALGCWGDGCNGKDPAATGCNVNAYLAKRVIFKDTTYGLAIWQTYADVYYSNSCGTNWLRVTNNPWGGKTYKEIASLNSNRSIRYKVVENDYTYGSSYTMMVYAPGNTPITAWAKLYDQSGRGQADIVPINL